MKLLKAVKNDFFDILPPTIEIVPKDRPADIRQLVSTPGKQSTSSTHITAALSHAKLGVARSQSRNCSPGHRRPCKPRPCKQNE